MYGYEVLPVWTMTTDTNGYFLLCDSILNRNLYWLVCTRSLVLCIGFCRLLFVLLSFFFWPLCCLSFFDIVINTTSASCAAGTAYPSGASEFNPGF
jgi:hypothetical protein